MDVKGCGMIGDRGTKASGNPRWQNRWQVAEKCHRTWKNSKKARKIYCESCERR